MHGEAAVLVLAAGAGTRMRSDTPKVLHTLAGRSMLSHALHSVAKVAPQHLVVVLGHDRDRVAPAVAELADELGRPIDIAVQDQQLGTGHAVRLRPVGTARRLHRHRRGDLWRRPAAGRRHAGRPDRRAQRRVGRRDRAHHDAARSDRLRPHPAHPGRRGHRRSSSRPTPRPSQRAIREVNAGVYAFDIAALRSALSRLRSHNAQQELYLTDVISIVRSDGHVVRAKHVDDCALVAGVNDRVQLAELGAELNRRIVAAHQRAGVTIVDPATTWIDVDVTVGRDTVVYPGTQLLGATRIGGRCQIGPDTTLTDVTVGDDATVVRTHGGQSVIGDGAAVGPFAYLRPGTALGADGKLGAFVETKNSTIGAGTKVPHLTYVGDADIGEHSNIGASSVFVNYDGENKSRTTIGSHVRTGSDTMFVAPVTVGDGAYTGAGTVVRDDVPPGALAVSAGPQRNIEGWVERKRPGSAAAAAAAAASGSAEATSSGPGEQPNSDDAAQP